MNHRLVILVTVCATVLVILFATTSSSPPSNASVTTTTAESEQQQQQGVDAVRTNKPRRRVVRNVGGGDEVLPPRRSPGDAQHQQQQQDNADDEEEQERHLRDIIFSCFFYRADFYKGRKVPSLDWIVVMIESAFEFRRRKACAGPISSVVSSRRVRRNIYDQAGAADNNAGAASIPADINCELRIVMFVDSNTKSRLTESLRTRNQGPLQRPNFFRNGFLELVLIDPERDAEFGAVYSGQAWANPEQLGNSANNFRFWLIRRYLRDLYKYVRFGENNNNRKRQEQQQQQQQQQQQPQGDSSPTTVSAPNRVLQVIPVYRLDDMKQRQEHDQIIDAEIEAIDMKGLGRMRILISDATDVLFQRSPFEDGVCFPHIRQRTSRVTHTRNIFLYTLEDSSKSFANEKYNRRWMKCYDKLHDEHVGHIERQQQENDAALLLQQPAPQASERWSSPLQEMARAKMRVSCAGVSLGSYFGVLAYLNAQLREISNPILTKCAIEDIKAALDQATHNNLMFQTIWKPRQKVNADRGKDTKTNNNNSSSSKLVTVNGGDSWNIAVKTGATQFGSQAVGVFVAAVPTGARERQRSDTVNWDRWTLLKTRLSADDAPIGVEHQHPSSDEVELLWDSADDSFDCVFHGNFAKVKFQGDEAQVGGAAKMRVVSSSPFAAAGSNAPREFAIVHQYTSDRHPRVMRMAKERYRI